MNPTLADETHQILQVATPIHWLLAFAGMLIHLLKNLNREIFIPGFTIGGFMKEKLIPILMNLIMIPVLMIITSDGSLQAVIPTSYVTAALYGYSTQSIFDGLIDMGMRKITKNKTTDENIPRY